MHWSLFTCSTYNTGIEFYSMFLDRLLLRLPVWCFCLWSLNLQFVITFWCPLFNTGWLPQKKKIMPPESVWESNKTQTCILVYFVLVQAVRYSKAKAINSESHKKCIVCKYNCQSLLNMYGCIWWNTFLTVTFIIYLFKGMHLNRVIDSKSVSELKYTELKD